MHPLVSVLAVLVPACYPPPVEAPVARPFLAPACTYCPGHRGVEYDVSPGTRVRAVAAGVVRFSGAVAGTRYVVILQDDGFSATYGDLQQPLLGAGARVRAGDPVGTSTDVVYFGLRDDGTYIDPSPRLGRWKRRVRLVPSSGRSARPARPPQLVCPGG